MLSNFLSYFQYSISSYFKADRKFTVLKDRIYSSFLKTLNRNDSNHSSRLFEAFLLLKQWTVTHFEDKNINYLFCFVF